MKTSSTNNRVPGLSPAQAAERLARFLSFYHPGVSPEDLERTTTRGYWRMKSPCGGAAHCSNPLHGFLGNSEGCQHTIAFTEHGKRVNGRFVRPFRVWEALDQAPALA